MFPYGFFWFLLVSFGFLMVSFGFLMVSFGFLWFPLVSFGFLIVSCGFFWFPLERIPLDSPRPAPLFPFLFEELRRLRRAALPVVEVVLVGAGEVLLPQLPGAVRGPGVLAIGCLGVAAIGALFNPFFGWEIRLP